MDDKKVLKVKFYGDENGPYEDVNKGVKYSDGYIMYDDNTIYRTNNYEEILKAFNDYKNVDGVCQAYDDKYKYQQHYEYDSEGVPVNEEIKPAQNDGNWGKAVGALGLTGLGLLSGIAIANRNNKSADTVPNPDTNNVVNDLTSEEQRAKVHLDDHFEYTHEQDVMITGLSSTLEAMHTRCAELGIEGAAFNTDEALVFSLMMSDISDEEAARYCQTFGYTADEMMEIYQSAIMKVQVIQATVNDPKDVSMFDNLIIKVAGQSDRLSKEENQEKLQNVLNAIHGAIEYNIAINNAKAEDIDAVKGTVKLPNGKVITFQEIMDYDFALLKSNKTVDMNGNTVYGFEQTEAARKVYMDSFMLSHLYGTTNMDSYVIGDTYNVDGKEEKGTVALEYVKLSNQACAYTIDFDQVEYLSNNSNKELIDYVITLTGNSDVKAYRDATYAKTYDKDIENLRSKYNNKLWNELSEKEQQDYLNKIVEKNNKIRKNSSVNNNSKGSETHNETVRTVETWTEEAKGDVVKEEKTGSGDKKEDAQEKLNEEVKEHEDDLNKEMEENGGSVVKEDNTTTGEYRNDDGSGVSEQIVVTKDDEGNVISEETTRVEIDQTVLDKETTDGNYDAEDPLDGEKETYETEDAKKSEEYEENERVNEEVKELIKDAKAEEKKEEEKKEEVAKEGNDWEAYFDELYGDTNDNSVTVEVGEYVDTTDHGPLAKTP